MVLKAAVVFIAGGLTGSGIVALSRSAEQVQPAVSRAEASAITSPVPAATAVPDTSFDALQPQDQPAYVQARFAVQRPFAALHPPQR